MPAEGKISLDASQYQRTLEEVKSKTAKTSDDMTKSVDNFGKSVGKSANAVSALSSEVGSSFGTISKVIGAAVSGPIALLIASIGVAVSVAKNAWDSLTESTEEYSSRLDKVSSLEQKRYKDLVQAQKEEEGYLERLNELSESETHSNEEKDEAVTLIAKLNERYGDLGITIDEVTGKIIGLGNAERKVNEQHKKELMKSLQDQLDAEKAKSDAETTNYFVGGTGSKVLNWLGGKYQSSVDYAEEVKNTPLEKRRDEILGMMRHSQLNKDELDYYSKQLDHLNTMIDLQKRLNSMKETGVETEAEHARVLKESSQKASEQEKARKAKEAEEQKAWEAELARQEEEERKANERASRKAEQDAKIEKQKKENWEQFNVNQAFSLREQAMRASGQGKQADIDSAIWQATQTKGEALTGDEYSRIVEMTKARSELASLQVASPLNYAPRVNSLIARGGSEAPVKMPKVEELQSRTLSNVEKILLTSERILGSIDDWITI